MTTDYGIILLAAGSSGRMGRPKQLLPYKGSTLLRYLVNEAAAASGTLIVVLGAHASLVTPVLEKLPVTMVYNPDWQEGMASSIRCGITALQKNVPGIKAAILMTCDQPFVTTGLLKELIATHQHTGRPVVSSSYDNTTGPPVLFQRSVFPELLQLSGDKGARRIVEAYKGRLATVAFPKGHIDIDTAADYDAIERL